MEEEQSSRWCLLHPNSSAITLRQTRRHTWKTFLLASCTRCCCCVSLPRRRGGLIPNPFFLLVLFHYYILKETEQLRARERMI